MVRVRRSWLLLLSGVAGCAPVADDSGSADSGVEQLPLGAIADECDGLTPKLELGTGATEFEAVTDGQPLTMVHGPQGGWHMLAAAMVTNTANVVLFTYEIEVVASGVQISSNRYNVALLAETTCTSMYAGLYGYLDVAPLASGDADTPPELLAGQEVRLSLSASDAAGRTASDQRTVVAALDPADEP